MSFFILGDFKLNSGAKSEYRIECDDFTNSDIKCLAYLIARIVDNFGTVEGVPGGGLRLAKELQYYSLKHCKTHLIVDDVLTTGNSMEKAKDIQFNNNNPNVIGAVVFSRKYIPSDSWIKALFMLNEAIRFDLNSPYN